MHVTVYPLFFKFLAACRKDEQYKICPGCPATCQHDEPFVCFLPCVAKCVCRPGLLRDELTRRCVMPENCPNKTADNVTDVDNNTATAVLEAYQRVNESTTTLLPENRTVQQKGKL